MKLKRFAAPKNWPIERKIKKFAITPKPGPHVKNRCIPLGIILRDILKYAETLKEVKEILNKGMVRIDGKIKKDHGFPVGLMDVLTVGKEYYRTLPGSKGLYVQKINNPNIKLMRIENKTNVNKKVQLNMHDGRNILVDKDSYKTGDTVIFDLEKKSFSSLKMKKGSAAIIVSGKNIGKTGKIDEIIVTKSHQPNQIKIKVNKEVLVVPKKFVFVIGDDKEIIGV